MQNKYLNFDCFLNIITRLLKKLKLIITNKLIFISIVSYFLQLLSFNSNIKIV